MLAGYTKPSGFVCRMSLRFVSLFRVFRSAAILGRVQPQIWEEMMKFLARKVQRFLVSEDGPTAVEYAVMLALIIIVCLTAISAVGTHAATQFNNIATEIGTAGS